MFDFNNNPNDYYVYNKNEEHFDETMSWEPIPTGVEEAIEREIKRILDPDFLEKEKRETPFRQLPQRIIDRGLIDGDMCNDFQRENITRLWNQKVKENYLPLEIFGRPLK